MSEEEFKVCKSSSAYFSTVFYHFQLVAHNNNSTKTFQCWTFLLWWTLLFLSPFVFLLSGFETFRSNLTFMKHKSDLTTHCCCCSSSCVSFGENRPTRGDVGLWVILVVGFLLGNNSSNYGKKTKLGRLFCCRVVMSHKSLMTLPITTTAFSLCRRNLLSFFVPRNFGIVFN